jgi:hypothetical protein
MDFDLALMCDEHQEKLDKKFQTQSKNFLKDLSLILGTIKDKHLLDRNSEIIGEAEVLHQNYSNRMACLYTECLNKIKAVVAG